MIYFSEKNGLIKIGCSKQPGIRAKFLGSKLLGVMDGDFKAEKATHKLFGAWRDHGEWFSDCSAIREYIAENCSMDFVDSKVKRHLYLTEDMTDAIKSLAKKEGRSFSNMVNVLLWEQLEREGKRS